MTRRPLSEFRQEIRDIIPRMTVQTGTETFLIEEMGDETDGATEDEEAVEDAHLEVILGLLGAEGARIAEQVHEANGDAAIDVEDQVILFRRGDGLDREGVIEKFGVGEVVLAVLFDQGHTEIRVVAGFDAVADAGDCKARGD